MLKKEGIKSIKIELLLIVIFLFIVFELCKYNFYIVKQAIALINLYSKAVPVNQVLNDSLTSNKTTEFLNKTIDIKQFALNQLGLSYTKNYDLFIKTNKNYLVDIVCAADSYSFKQKQWRFFFFYFPYLGFFNKNDAVVYYNFLATKNLDIVTYPVDGFSTLGFLKDPLFSFMEKYSDYYLAELLIHELTHSTIFINNDIELSENLAEFISKTGAMQYLYEKNYTASYIQSIVDYQYDDITFSKDIYNLYLELSKMYGITPKNSILSEKAKVIDKFKLLISKNIYKKYRTKKYSNSNSMILNNASILIMLTYSKRCDTIASFYSKNNYNLRNFILFCINNKKILSSLF